MQVIPTTHPGIILKEEFAVPYNLTQAQLAKAVNVSVKTINEIYNQKRGITPLMALKLAKLFGTTPEFWMNFQTHYDLYRIYQKEKDQVEQVKNLKTA